MTTETETSRLTESLEDYLETTYELVREAGFARVKDIAKARDVKPASVSQAVQRLADLKLVNYEKRGFLTLTPEGEEHARSVLARHEVLKRLFREILRIDPSTAARDACTMEHGLSIEAMDKIVKFFEYIGTCPDARDIIERFHGCARIHDAEGSCEHRCESDLDHHHHPESEATTLARIGPWKHSKVVQITGTGAVRQRLLDMGLLPGVVVEVERVAPSGDPLWVRVGGFQLSLRRSEAETILVLEV